jgi:hypothetical protein
MYKHPLNPSLLTSQHAVTNLSYHCLTIITYLLHPMTAKSIMSRVAKFLLLACNLYDLVQIVGFFANNHC